MGIVTKIYCDRCKKEIINSEHKILRIHTTRGSYTEEYYYFCDSCAVDFYSFVKMGNPP